MRVNPLIRPLVSSPAWHIVAYGLHICCYCHPLPQSVAWNHTIAHAYELAVPNTVQNVCVCFRCCCCCCFFFIFYFIFFFAFPHYCNFSTTVANESAIATEGPAIVVVVTRRYVVVFCIVLLLLLQSMSLWFLLRLIANTVNVLQWAMLNCIYAHVKKYSHT